MNFQQLRIVRETVRRNFNLSDAAEALFTSQSGVSKHIKDLEDELGVELFVRKGKRLLGLTEPGKELAQIVERMLLDARNIKALADQFRKRDEGQLTIATTHTQARYALPRVVIEFKRLFPKVHLALHQGSPGEIVSMLQLGEADIGVATERLGGVRELAAFAFYTWRHALIVPKDHPLTRHPAPSLELVAEYPLITYHEGFTGRERIDQAFAAAGLSPDVVMSALDADVIKTYVALGLGVGIIASMAYDPEHNGHLTLLQTDPAFEQNVTQIAVRRGRYLRGYAYRFIELCSAGLTESVVRTALTPPVAPDVDV